MDFDFDIIASIERYGFITTLVVTLGLGAIKIFFANLFDKLKDMLLGADKKKTGDLNKHPIFHRLENYISVKIPGIQFDDEGRGMVFKDMLTTMIRCYVDLMRKIISDGFNPKGEATFSSNDDFIQKLSNYGVNTIKDYEDQWRKMGIPLICINKFNEWHSRKRDILFEDIQTIANSSFHESYNEKIASFFDSVLTILNVSVIDAEYILKDLNGELSCQIYKGVTIGHGQDTCVIRSSDEESSSTRIPYKKKKSEIINFTEERED